MGENEMIQRLWNKDCLKKAVALAESELAGRAKIYRFSDWHRVSSWVLAAESLRQK